MISELSGKWPVPEQDPRGCGSDAAAALGKAVPWSYNEHKQTGLIWEVEEGPGQPGQSQQNMDKQQKWLGAVTSSVFSYSSLCACWLFHPAREGGNPDS